MRSCLIVFVAFAGCVVAGCNGTYTPSHWLEHVPPAARAAADPLTVSPANQKAGGEIYQLYCVSCHGDAGIGRRGRPSLRSARVRGETDGDLYWILDNGSRNHGMPAWKSLGSTALWQLVQYIRTLPAEPQARR